ncbi:flagellar hook protein FlgE [Quadrisphaera granulorum]|uniref:Flagellar hook protein FlgE n=1 Tax=Quadrisphaera granulorum TaxID=317664 RepID=A0A316AR75_9ACTN|nr:flagellar basal-body rod protein FlgF [Quadrisphaera granulorum]PWJ52587.1 flagellar hook protein FlgE [Quadrisphaera granulorum]SZE97637.1 flagellar hook protein FlgE [Quadrisphaera granulorum]
MLRSLYAGISGLRSQQTLMDVTGNNIANVNTTAFKTSTTQFQDTLSQVVAAAGRATTGDGGTNPAQIGLGVRVAGITTNFTQGAAQLTGKSTDMMIQGDGFFVVNKGNEQMYTRAGAFSFDALGQLVTTDGAILQGWKANADGSTPTNGATSNMTIPAGTLLPPAKTTTWTLGNNFADDAPVNAGAVTNISTLTAGSYVGPVKAPTTYDTLGVPADAQVTFVHSVGGASPDEWKMFWTAPGTGALTDSGAVIKFNADGTPNLTGSVLTTTAASVSTPAIPVGLKLTIANTTGYAGTNVQKNSSGVVVSSNSTAAITSQDGSPAGSISAFSLGADGTITGTFDNGFKKILGKVALASFSNPSGLTKQGNSLYSETTNSGVAQVGAANAAGRGALAGGTLEMSNVDLSQEFTNLIVAQRGFQANSRVITASDEMLQELGNMKR